MKSLLVILLVLSSFNSFAKNQVESINLNKSGNEFNVVLKNNEKVELTQEIKENIFQIEVENAIVWPKIEKMITHPEMGRINAMAYQFNSKTVRVRFVFDRPKSLQKITPNVRLHDKKILFSYTKNTVPSVNKYDESYLSGLLEDQKKKEQKRDEIKLNLSSVKKEKSEPTVSKINFSVWGYVAKFFSFLAVMLLFLYGGLQFVKKGAFKRGKIGFLNNSELIKVLATHHLGNKKSLMIVQASEQVFLLSGGDQGLSLISELNHPTDVRKKGEEILFGSNFDSSVETEEKNEKEFKVKENISESLPLDESTSFNQITNKIKQRVSKNKGMQ